MTEDKPLLRVTAGGYTTKNGRFLTWAEIEELGEMLDVIQNVQSGLDDWLER